MITKWKLTVNSNDSDAVFEITYSGGRFKKIEHKTGKLTKQILHERLLILAPQLEAVIPLLEVDFKDRPVKWEMISKGSQSVIKQLTDEYYKWYQDRNDIPPKLDGTEVKAMKLIHAYLLKLSTDDGEAVAVFNSLLSHWDKFPEFYRQQMNLRQINSNLNTLLRLLKNGDKHSTTRGQAESVSDDLRGGFKAS